MSLPTPTDSKQILLAAAGVVGGLTIGKWMVEHLFVEGLDPEERRNIILFGATTGTVFLVREILKNKFWWLTPEDAIEKFDAEGVSL